MGISFCENTGEKSEESWEEFSFLPAWEEATGASGVSPAPLCGPQAWPGPAAAPAALAGPGPVGPGGGRGGENVLSQPDQA